MATGRAGSIYLLAGVLGAILIGPYLVLVLLACGLFELVRRGWFSRWLGSLLEARGPRRRGLYRRHRRAGLDGPQGRRPLVRRGLRDHPADAGRRRATSITG